MIRSLSPARAAFVHARGVAATLLVAGVALTAPTAAIGQDQPAPAQQPPAEPQTLLVLDYAGPAELLPSPKDSALARALAMIPLRAEELMRQVPELAGVPRPAADLAFGVLSHPVRLAITNKGFDQKTGMPGFGSVLSFSLGKDQAGEEAAQAMHRNFDFVRKQAAPAFQPSASKKFQGMTDLPLPVGVLSYGPRRATDGWRYELIFAAIDDPEAPFKALPAAVEGLRPTVRARLDVAAWSPLIQMFAGFAAMASPQGKDMMNELRESGMIGPDAVSIDLIQGYTKDASAGLITVRKLGRFAEMLGVSRETISAADLAVVPTDATAAQIKKTDLKLAWSKLREQLKDAPGGEFDEFLRQFQSETGVDFENEVIANLGTTTVVYVSDSTGGGSILSAVGLLSLVNPEKLSTALGKIAIRLNGLLRENVPPPGRVEIARFEDDGVRFLQLRFPGLPVPFEPTLAVAGDWLVIGGTPQAATAAAQQVKLGNTRAGLAANPAFSGGRWKTPDVTSVAFVDTARTLRDGYPIVTQIGSAISNATRSDEQGGREPGAIVPGFTALRDGARAAIAVSYWQGDDFVMENRGDLSMLVNAAGILGVADLGEFVIGAMLGGGIGAQAASEAARSGGFDRGETSDHRHEQDTSDEAEPDSDKADHPAGDGEPSERREQPRRPAPY